MPSYAPEVNVRGGSRATFNTDPAALFDSASSPADRKTILGVEVVSRSCGTTSGSATVTCANTTDIEVGMVATGTGVSGGLAVTSQVTGNTFTYNSHGIPDGARVSFSAMANTTGVTLNRRYYVVGSAANTFQISTTLGGSAVDLTGTDGTATLHYHNTVVSITTDTNVVLDVPAKATGTATLAFRQLPVPYPV